MDFLRPTVDIVFKLLFTRNPLLLRSLLSAVLRRTVEEAEVLNPAIDLRAPLERGLVLDIRVRLGDGAIVDVEMQCDPGGARPDRWLYHWARAFCDVLQRGDDFSRIVPVICVIFLDIDRGGAFHEEFGVREVTRHTPLSNAFTLHLVQVPRYLEHAQDESPELVQWSRFLRARSAHELDCLAAENPIMAEARRALYELTADDMAREAAIARDKNAVLRNILRMEGREEGLEEGREESRQALLTAFWALTEAFGVDPGERGRWQQATASELSEAIHHLGTHRALPPR